MNFYYDPILGLQYNNIHIIFIIDISAIPKNFNIEEFVQEWLKQPCNLIFEKPKTEITYLEKITQYFLK